MRFHRFFIALAPILGTAGVLAQNPDPPELVAKRNEHETAVKQATATITARYEQMLRDLKDAYLKEGNADAANAVAVEIHSLATGIKDATDRSSGIKKTVNGVGIISATYRDVKHKHTFDITLRVRQKFESGAESLIMNTREAADGKDPSVGRAKETLLIYTVDGERRQIIIPEGRVLNFKEDLK
jgi:hypothetical protein